MASGHHGDSWKNKPMNHDGRGSGLISSLHNADKTADHIEFIGNFLFSNIFFKCKACLHPYVEYITKKKKIIECFQSLSFL